MNSNKHNFNPEDRKNILNNNSNNNNNRIKNITSLNYILSKYLTYICFILIIISFIPNANSEPYGISLVNYSGIDNGLEVKVYANSADEQVKLFYKHELDLNYSEIAYQISSETFTIPTNELELEGRYEFYAENTSGSRFPENQDTNIIFYIGDSDNTFYDYYLNFALNDSTSASYCQPLQGDYECKIESFQAQQIELFSKLYSDTDNESYLDIVNQLMKSDWTKDNPSSNYCGPNNNDFDCGSISFIGTTYTGADRQSSIISSLWKAYSHLNNETIREMAVNFSSGHNQECDVWSGDYQCSNQKDQATMASAYAYAYYFSGNDTYKEIMNSLLENLDNSTKESVIAYSDVYRLTGNKSYASAAYNVAMPYLTDCSDTTCDEYEFSTQLKLLTNLMVLPTNLISENNKTISIIVSGRNQSVTFKHYLNLMMRKMLNISSSGSCDPGTDWNCELPSQQYSMASSFYDIAINIKSKNRFYDFRSYNPEAGKVLNLSIKRSGIMNNPRIYFRDSFVGGEFNNISIPWHGFISIEEEYASDSLILDAYFYDFTSSTRYPSSGYLKVALPYLDNDSIDKTKGLSENDPLLFCEPNSGNDYSCRYEYMQGDYMDALYSVYDLNNTFNNIITELSSTEIDTTEKNIYSSCDPYENDFICEKEAWFAGDSYKKQGVYRASSLLNGLLSNYFLNNDAYSLDLSLKYAKNGFYECDPWDEDYNCGNIASISKLITAMTRLYDATGSSKIKNMVKNLTQETYSSYQLDSDLAISLLKAYPLITNTTLKSDINSSIISFLDSKKEAGTCLNQNCSIEKLSEYLTLFSESYIFFKDEDYKDFSVSLSKENPSHQEDYCKPNSDDVPDDTKYSCILPSHQVELIKGFDSFRKNNVIYAFENYSLDINGPDEGDLYSQAEANCILTNYGISTATAINLMIDTNLEIISKYSNISYDNITKGINITELGPGETANFSFMLNLTKGGVKKYGCYTSSNPTEEKEIRIGNIGDFLSIDTYFEQINLNQAQGLINLQNKYDFGLRNVSIKFNSSTPISNIIIEGWDYYPSQKRLETSYMAAGYNKNATIIFDIQDDYYDFLSAQSTAAYEGNTNSSTFEFYAINGIPQITYDQPENPIIYNYHNISFSIYNDKPFTLHNFSLEFNLSEDLEHNKTYIESSSVGTSTSINSLSLEPGEYMVALLTFWLKGDAGVPKLEEGENINDTINISITSYALNQTYSGIIRSEFTPDKYAISLSNASYELEEGTTNSYDINITNLASEQLNNITINLSFVDENQDGFSILSVDEIDEAYVLSSKTYGDSQGDNNATLYDRMNESDWIYHSFNITNETSASLYLTANYTENIWDSYSDNSVLILKSSAIPYLESSSTISLNISAYSSKSGDYQEICNFPNMTYSEIECGLSSFINSNEGVGDGIMMMLNFSTYGPGSEVKDITIEIDEISLDIKKSFLSYEGETIEGEIFVPLMEIGEKKETNISIISNDAPISNSLIMNALSDSYAKGYNTIELSSYEKNNEPVNPSSSGGGGGGSTQGDIIFADLKYDFIKWDINYGDVVSFEIHSLIDPSIRMVPEYFKISRVSDESLSFYFTGEYKTFKIPIGGEIIFDINNNSDNDLVIRYDGKDSDSSSNNYMISMRNMELKEKDNSINSIFSEDQEVIENNNSINHTTNNTDNNTKIPDNEEPSKIGILEKLLKFINEIIKNISNFIYGILGSTKSNITINNTNTSFNNINNESINNESRLPNNEYPSNEIKQTPLLKTIISNFTKFLDKIYEIFIFILPYFILIIILGIIIIYGTTAVLKSKQMFELEMDAGDLTHEMIFEPNRFIQRISGRFNNPTNKIKSKHKSINKLKEETSNSDSSQEKAAYEAILSLNEGLYYLESAINQNDFNGASKAYESLISYTKHAGNLFAYAGKHQEELAKILKRINSAYKSYFILNRINNAVIEMKSILDSGKPSEAMDYYRGLYYFISKNNSMITSMTNYTPGVNMLTTEIKNTYKRIIESLRKERTDTTDTTKQKKPSNKSLSQLEEEHPEYNLYIKLNRIDQLLDKNKIDEAEHAYSSLEKDVNDLNDLERPKEKSFLLQKLAKKRKKIDENKGNVWYKLKNMAKLK